MTPSIVPKIPIKEPAIKKIRIIENLEKKFSQINPTGNFEFKKTQEVSEEENKKLEDELRKLGYI